MADTTPNCPKCSASMEKGYIADLTYGCALQSAWTPGEPKPRRILGGVKWSQTGNMAIVTFRCERFGFLESYAPRA
jgi:hypothetical protein